jgi:hypothetical protein
MPGKYAPLESHLLGVSIKSREVTITFGEIEGILKSKLPASANELSWWEHETEGNHRNTRAWANAGWRVETVNLREKWVRFVRVG